MRLNQREHWHQTAVHGLAAKCCLLFLLAACFAFPARADLVSGRVSGAEGEFEAKDFDSVMVKRIRPIGIPPNRRDNVIDDDLERPRFEQIQADTGERQ